MDITKNTTGKHTLLFGSEDGVLAIGHVSFEDTDKSQYVVVSIEHLERAIKTVKQINKTECIIRMENDKPILISPGSSKQSTIGLLIAPRIVEEMR